MNKNSNRGLCQSDSFWALLFVQTTQKKKKKKKEEGKVKGKNKRKRKIDTRWCNGTKKKKENMRKKKTKGKQILRHVILKSVIGNKQQSNAIESL